MPPISCLLIVELTQSALYINRYSEASHHGTLGRKKSFVYQDRLQSFHFIVVKKMCGFLLWFSNLFCRAAIPGLEVYILGKLAPRQVQLKIISY